MLTFFGCKVARSRRKYYENDYVQDQGDFVHRLSCGTFYMSKLVARDFSDIQESALGISFALMTWPKKN